MAGGSALQSFIFCGECPTLWKSYSTDFTAWNRQVLDADFDVSSDLGRVVEIFCGEDLWSVFGLRVFPRVSNCGYAGLDEK